MLSSGPQNPLGLALCTAVLSHSQLSFSSANRIPSSLITIKSTHQSWNLVWHNCQQQTAAAHTCCGSSRAVKPGVHHERRQRQRRRLVSRLVSIHHCSSRKRVNHPTQFRRSQPVGPQRNQVCDVCCVLHLQPSRQVPLRQHLPVLSWSRWRQGQPPSPLWKARCIKGGGHKLQVLGPVLMRIAAVS